MAPRSTRAVKAPTGLRPSIVRASAKDRVHFLGFRFGEDYHARQGNTPNHVQATERYGWDHLTSPCNSYFHELLGTS